MWKDFKAFVLRGNVLDLAVAVIIGAAFGTIVTSLVNDIIMPPIGLLLGGVDFSNLFISLKGSYGSLAEAQAAGAPTINYGLFINHIITFLIVALAVFLVVRAVKGLQKPPEVKAPEVTTKTCPECLSEIPIGARRCAHCTVVLE